jgi:hypothetical protein
MYLTTHLTGTGFSTWDLINLVQFINPILALCSMVLTSACIFISMMNTSIEMGLNYFVDFYIAPEIVSTLSKLSVKDIEDIIKPFNSIDPKILNDISPGLSFLDIVYPSYASNENINLEYLASMRLFFLKFFDICNFFYLVKLASRIDFLIDYLRYFEFLPQLGYYELNIRVV